MLTQRQIDSFFFEKRQPNKVYEDMWKEEKEADERVMKRVETEQVFPSSVEVEEHKMKYFWNQKYNDYLIEKYGKDAMYRRFGSVAFTQYYHNGVLKKRCVKLKTRFASFMK